MAWPDIHIPIATAGLIACATPAMVEPLTISDPALCGAPEEAVWDAGGFTMTDRSVEAIEFLCEFDPLAPYDPELYGTVTRKGFCAGPMFLIPQVFAFSYGTGAGDIEMIGQFAQYVPSGRIVFYVCD